MIVKLISGCPLEELELLLDELLVEELELDELELDELELDELELGAPVPFPPEESLPPQPAMNSVLLIRNAVPIPVRDLRSIMCVSYEAGRLCLEALKPVLCKICTGLRL